MKIQIAEILMLLICSI